MNYEKKIDRQLRTELHRCFGDERFNIEAIYVCSGRVVGAAAKLALKVINYVVTVFTRLTEQPPMPHMLSVPGTE